MFQQLGERARLVPVIGVTLGLALPAAAQQPTPKVAVSLGYVVVRDQDIYRETFPLGWNVEVATRLTRRLNIVGEVGGVYPRIMKGGEMDAGAWSCGMVAGLIRDVPTVKELIDRIMSEAERIIGGRLKGFMRH